jgi:murein DD-endopeptidase MepM/ murein hydrolase activator NlpD
LGWHFAIGYAGGAALEEPQPLHFYPSTDKKVWRTFLTAPLDVIEDVYQVVMDAVAADGTNARLSSDYAARHGVYRNANLTVSKVFSEPPPEVKARQQQDFQETLAALAQRTERQWTQPFILPTRGGYRDNFGDKRTYHRTKRSRHAGIDMTAATGTAISAMNDGVIALSADHFAPGQNIILNHGGGVFSKYIHLSRRDVKTGDQVKRGDVIALSGNSGSQKVGPHLHLDIFANGAAVNPLQFMRVAQQMLDAEAGRPVKT